MTLKISAFLLSALALDSFNAKFISDLIFNTLSIQKNLNMTTPLKIIKICYLKNVWFNILKIDVYTVFLKWGHTVQEGTRQ